MQKTDNLSAFTTRIVSAYVTENPIDPDQIPQLIGKVGGALKQLSEASGAAAGDAPTPAVAPKKSLGKDHLVCLECGARLRMLKRHLAQKHNLTPDAYRERYKLGSDYPMVAPNYSSRRAGIAKDIGLGQKPATKTDHEDRAAAE